MSVWSLILLSTWDGHMTFVDLLYIFLRTLMLLDWIFGPGVEQGETRLQHKYYMSNKMGDFKLDVVEGDFTDSQTVVMLMQNDTKCVRMNETSYCLHTGMCIPT